ncbi:formimidoylglutamate deiminase [Lentibacter sp.]|uniref:formimidoylglutamate deiminase n=1 Tax=Lentibacter sp. TaxID=2024994 RepID=UPI003F69C770
MTVIHAKQMLTPEGWVQNRAVHIGADGRIAALTAQEGACDSAVDMLLPAAQNLHSHAFQRAMSGLTEMRGPDPSDSFWTWRRLMYRYLDRLTPDDIEAIAAQVFLEMLEAGYAGVAEFHYLHHDVGGAAYGNLGELSERIVAAAEGVGIGLTLLPVLYQWGGCDSRALQGGQQRFGNTPEQYLRLHEAAARAVRASHADYHIGVAPHSLRAVDADGLRAALGAAGHGPIHMHLAEQVAEVEEVEAAWGARPVEWLFDHHEIDARWCMIHATQMNARETERLATSGAVAGLCPITESSLGDGIFNGVAYLSHGGRLGFGSDSNIHIAYFDELRTLEYSQRLRDRSRAALATAQHSTGRVLIEAALQGGAQAAGRQSGAIVAGHWADLVGISTDNAWVCNRSGDAALDTLVFGGHGQKCVSEVWSAGRHIVRGGEHAKRREISERFCAVVERLGQDI